MLREVQLGDTAILLCNISYHYKITWLKHNPEQTPAVLLCVSLNGGNIIYGHRPNLRFETEIANRSLALKIKSVEDADLGLYYCMGKIGESMMVGGGSRLHGKWGFLLVKNTCVFHKMPFNIIFTLTFILPPRTKTHLRWPATQFRTF